MTDRQALHRLIDRLPDNELYAARRFLEYLSLRDDPLMAIKAADPEPALTEPEPARVEQPREAGTRIPPPAGPAEVTRDLVREPVIGRTPPPLVSPDELAIDDEIKTRLGGTRHMQASSAYRQAMASNVDSYFQDPHFSAAVDFEDAKLYAEAAAEYVRHIEDKPLDAQAWYRLGNVQYLLKMNKEAVAAYQKATRIRPSHAEAHHSLADLYAEQENWADALREYQETLKISPTNLEAKRGAANAQIKLKKGK